MTKEQYLLLYLIEEMTECVNRASKAIRFTLQEKEPGQDLTNEERLIGEIVDVMAVAQMMFDKTNGIMKDVSPEKLEKMLKEKSEKIANMTQKSENLGVIIHANPDSFNSHTD
jgi:hypothetical protein